MSRLELYGRPWTVFDPTDKRHRGYYSDFVRNKSWGRCPVRFVVPEDHGNLLQMIQRSLVDYYVNREFGRAKPRAVLVRQKKKKTVDN